eukprot:7367075-Alexandrium_andersonii.AAC.1
MELGGEDPAELGESGPAGARGANLAAWHSCAGTIGKQCVCRGLALLFALLPMQDHQGAWRWRWASLSILPGRTLQNETASKLVAKCATARPSKLVSLLLLMG